MTIRPRSPDELPACVAVLREVHDASDYPTRWPDDPAAWLTPDGLVAAWVAEADGAVAGHVGALTGTAEPGLASASGIPADAIVLVTRLYVAPAARGRGYARALVATVLDYAAVRGLRAGLDVTEESVAAIALYESMGWRLVGRAEASWRTPDGRHPPLRYYLAPA